MGPQCTGEPSLRVCGGQRRAASAITSKEGSKAQSRHFALLGIFSTGLHVAIISKRCANKTPAMLSEEREKKSLLTHHLLYRAFDRIILFLALAAPHQPAHHPSFPPPGERLRFLKWVCAVVACPCAPTMASSANPPGFPILPFPTFCGEGGKMGDMWREKRARPPGQKLLQR